MALASADPKAGAKVFARCTACHDDSKGGPNKVGPELWSVVGRPIASADGFAYSAALQGLGGEWTFDKLDHFLTKPSDFAPGTKMSFAGLSKVEDRAAVIAYLNSQSDNPQPLPEAPAADAPAEGEAAAPRRMARPHLPPKPRPLPVDPTGDQFRPVLTYGRGPDIVMKTPAGSV
ncbi:c-type cytochrome [Tistrella bauzanensis]